MLGGGSVVAAGGVYRALSPGYICEGGAADGPNTTETQPARSNMTTRTGDMLVTITSSDV